MKKQEIIQLALIILGVLVIVRALESLSLQVGMVFGDSSSYFDWTYYIIGILFALIFMMLIGYLVIVKSWYLSKKIIHEPDENKELTTMTRFDAIVISVTIVGLYFIISGFPRFIGSLFTVGIAFFNDYQLFKQIYSGQLWGILQYFLVILIFMNSTVISQWIDSRIAQKSQE